MSLQKKKAMSGLILLILGFFLSGCAPLSYQVQVNGYSQPAAAPVAPPPASFFVIDNREAKDPVLEKGVKEKIEKLLGIQGYVLTAFAQADYYLVFSYGQAPARPGWWTSTRMISGPGNWETNGSLTGC